MENIRAVYVSGFRGIREGAVEGLRELTLIVGRNGAGKSSVLEAIYLASVAVEPDDAVRGIHKLDYVVDRRGAGGGWDAGRRHLWHSSHEGPMRIALDTSAGRVEVEVLDAPKSERPVRLGPGPAGEILRGVVFVDAELTARLGQLWAQAEPEVAKRALNMVKVGFDVDEGAPVGALGGGATSALATLLVALAYRPSVLLIEEPERHMHPTGLYAYVKALLQLARELGMQVIAATHSSELIYIAHVLSKEEGIGASVVHLERERGELTARALSIEEAVLLAKLGIDARFLYVF